MNRSPASSTRLAPSPRTASLTDTTLCPGAGRAQGEWRLGEHDDGLGREIEGGQQSCKSGGRTRVSNLLHGEVSE